MPNSERFDTAESSPGSPMPRTLAEQLRYQRSLVDMARQLSGEYSRSVQAARGLVSQGRVIVENSGSDAISGESPQQHESPGDYFRGSARERRTKELDLLKQQGVPIVTVNKWQIRIGPLCIWPSSGRWLNKATESRGKLKSISMRDLIVREIPEIQISDVIAPKRAYEHRPLDDAEADCLRALERFVAEAQEFCETLQRFSEGDRTAADQLELCVHRDRENEAYAKYRRARRRLLKSAGFSFISESSS